MSRRSFPRIDPAALRDHADEARVERVWERIERDLASRQVRGGPRGPEAARARRASFAYLAVAAAFGAFGGGLLLGKATWGKRALDEATVVSPIIEKSEVEVLAAGTQLRTFPLHGGGTLTLSPGATVEVERAGEALTLKLLQGQASIGTARRALAVMVGEAQLNAQAGSTIGVTRNQDDVDVHVDDGSVSISSPAGTQQLGKDERAAVPIHAAIVSNAPVSAKSHRTPVLPLRRPSGRNPLAAKGASGPEWLVRHDANDDDGALAALRKHDINALIDASKSAYELNALAEIMRGKGGDQTAEMRACQRLVQSFQSDQRATLAAERLAQIYEARGEAARAKDYRAKKQVLAQHATTGSESLYCTVIRQEPDKTKAALMAKEYLSHYPDGDCRDALEQMLSSQGDAPVSPAEPVPAAAPPAAAP
jgi:hypothetical protein